MSITVPRLLEPLNALITPAVRHGVANPLPLTGGLVLLETTGRRSGKARTVPLLCADFGGYLVVSTARPRSQWVANLLEDPAPAVWLRGQRRPVDAAVFQRGALRRAAAVPETELASLVRFCSRSNFGSIVLLTLRPAAAEAAAA